MNSVDLYPSQQQTRDIFKDVLRERVAQEAKWGQQNHEQMIWMPILMEEVGEAAQAANEMYFQAKAGASEGAVGAVRDAIREELVQVAAVAVAMIESLDRNKK